MIIPAVLLIGPSGTGKSTAIKNLPKQKTTILNIEKKILPFREAFEFKKNVMLEAVSDFDTEFDKALKDPEAENIVIESLHRYSEKVLELAKSVQKGYEIYNFYADRMTKFITKVLKAEDKYIFITAIPELYKLENPNGTNTSKYRASFNGNLIEKMGGIESFFSIVLYSEAIVKNAGKEATYQLVCNTDGINSAKSPAGMFPFNMPNDFSVVKQKLKEYYNIKDLVLNP